jgi:hypothetical protein
MFLPWIGLFEQVRLADVFIHYDDVQLPQGRSFMSRVQIKTPEGITWLTAPIDRRKSGRLLNEVVYSTNTNWREQHLKTIRHIYSQAVFFEPMWQLISKIYENPTNNLALFNQYAIETIAEWMGLKPKFLCSSDMGIGGSSTQRLVELCKSVGSDIYVTGLGALNYLDYDQFETNSISVHYMEYRLIEYSQPYGVFTPYVSILDAIANCGCETGRLISSGSTYWREYLAKQT